jgi:hypothetical protein
MIEVFVGFTKESPFKELEQTLEAWDLPGLEPVAILVKPEKFELHRRVTAEKISLGDYIVATLGYGPDEEEFGDIAERELRRNPNVGMILPDGLLTAVVCRKGIVTHWPTPRSVSYNEEHIQAYERVGFKVILCPTIHCRLLAESLPS